MAAGEGALEGQFLSLFPRVVLFSHAAPRPPPPPSVSRDPPPQSPSTPYNSMYSYRSGGRVVRAAGHTGVYLYVQVIYTYSQTEKKSVDSCMYDEVPMAEKNMRLRIV